MRVKKIASYTPDKVRQNENLYLKKQRKMYHIIVYLLIKENVYLKLYLSGSKIEINAFLRVAYARGEGGLHKGELIRGVTEVLRKRWAYLQGCIYVGWGRLIGGEIRYLR